MLFREQVLSTRRGRCGEYSPLALHLLRAVGYVARWVADRDDHVSRCCVVCDMRVCEWQRRCVADSGLSHTLLMSSANEMVRL